MSTASLASGAEPAQERSLARAIGTGDPLSGAELRAAPLRCLPRPSRLGASVRALKGVGDKVQESLEALGVETLGDLLWHIPHGYRDPAAIQEIADLRIDQEATIAVEVRSAKVRPTRRRLRIVEAAVADASGQVTALWFNQAWLAEKLRPGTKLLLQGKLDRRAFKVKEYEVVGQGAAPAGLHTTGIVAVHPASERIRAQKLREWAWRAVAEAPMSLESLPRRVRARHRLAAAADALTAAHFPESRDQAEEARRRLAFEELFLHQAALASRRGGERTTRPGARARAARRADRQRWLESLPFEPTADQLRAFDEIDADLAQGRPMQRLLMGEVGSGKTVCALYAMLRAVESGAQAALMAPTETLAEQHAATMATLLARESVPFALLTGATPAARRREALERLATGELALVVGTHALIEPDVALRPAGCLRRRRAAPLRRPPALGARREGPRRRRPARPAHDRDADPADALADRLRRPRHDRAA